MHINQDGSLVQSSHAKRDGVALDFTMVDIGEGTVEGELLRDSVCLGQKVTCVELGIVAATFMDEIPFGALPFDGMVGLGLDSLAVANQLFSFPQQLATVMPGMLPQFSLSFRGAFGELTFGGPGPAFSGEPVWKPVYQPEEGYWQVRIMAVRVGNDTVHTCSGDMGCRGIIDTSASQLGVPAETLPGLVSAMSVSRDGQSCRGQAIHFDLGDGHVLTLQAEDYAGESCNAPRLVALNMAPAEKFAAAFVLGTSLLGRYDTIFDWKSLQIGFSQNQMNSQMNLPAQGVVTDGSLQQEVIQL